MQNWFKWGFILMCTSIAYVVLTLVYKCLESGLIAAFAHGVFCLQSIAMIVWIVFGSILRFSMVGKVCSGDYYHGDDDAEPYDWQAGQFMFVYLIIMYVVIGLFVCCGCCVGCAMVAGFTAAE